MHMTLFRFDKDLVKTEGAILQDILQLNIYKDILGAQRPFYKNGKSKR